MDVEVRAIPQGMHSVTPHIVVRDAARAAEWYPSALGAEEHDRLELPGGKLLYVELWFGDSAVRVADEFPEAGSYRRRASGARRSSSICSRTTSPRSGSGPSMRAPRSSIRSRISSGATYRGSSPIPSATGGTWPSTCGTFRARRSLAPLPRHSAARGGHAARVAPARLRRRGPTGGTRPRWVGPSTTPRIRMRPARGRGKLAADTDRSARPHAV